MHSVILLGAEHEHFCCTARAFDGHKKEVFFLIREMAERMPVVIKKVCYSVL